MYSSIALYSTLIGPVALRRKIIRKAARKQASKKGKGICICIDARVVSQGFESIPGPLKITSRDQADSNELI